MIKIHRMLTKTSNKVFRRKENDMVVIDKDENIDMMLGSKEFVKTI